jgi:large subunit ribosomal protein L17
MKHKRGFNPLQRMPSHRKALKRNMVTSLFKQERIKTTKAKALEVRRAAEKMITRAKEDSVHNRRIVSSRLFDEGIVAKLFTNIAPRMKNRNGGYTRIIKLGMRKGDAAEIVILELVDYKLDTDEGKKKSKKGEEKSKNIKGSQSAKGSQDSKSSQSEKGK